MEKRTHPLRPTLSSTETSQEAKDLVEELHELLRCEEMWYVAEKHLTRVRESIEAKYATIRDSYVEEDNEHRASEELVSE